MTKICKKYGIPNEFTDIKCFGDRVYYKDKRVMQLPTFCLYGGTFDDFIIQDKPGWQKIKGNIPPKYFQSFASIDGKKVSELPEDEQPSVVIFMKENFVDFKDKLYTKLQSIGVKKEEIICEFVHYIDFNLDWLDIRYNRKCPRELLIKEKQFAYQREIRFIINSSDKNIVEDLNKNTIDIGDLSGIAQYKDGYFEEGIDIEMDINLVEKE